MPLRLFDVVPLFCLFLVLLCSCSCSTSPVFVVASLVLFLDFAKASTTRVAEGATTEGATTKGATTETETEGATLSTSFLGPVLLEKGLL